MLNRWNRQDRRWPSKLAAMSEPPMKIMYPAMYPTWPNWTQYIRKEDSTRASGPHSSRRNCISASVVMKSEKQHPEPPIKPLWTPSKPIIYRRHDVCRSLYQTMRHIGYLTLHPHTQKRSISPLHFIHHSSLEGQYLLRASVTFFTVRFSLLHPPSL